MKLALRIALSLLLLALLLAYAIDEREMVRVLLGFHPGFLLLAFVVVMADRVLMTYKWLLLLRTRGYRLPLLHGVMIYCSSQVWGLALPATVGADAIRGVMVARYGVDGMHAAASIVIERIVGFLLALALATVSLIVLRSLGILPAAFAIAPYVGAALLIAAAVLVALSTSGRVSHAVLARLPRAARESKPVTYLARFASACRTLAGARGTLVAFGGLTVLEQLLSVVLPWVLALGLGVPADLLLMLGVLPLTNLVARLPISFDGLGVFEALFVGLLLLAGISAEAALSIALAGRIVQLAAFVPWWLAQVIGHASLQPTTRPLHGNGVSP